VTSRGEKPAPERVPRGIALLVGGVRDVQQVLLADKASRPWCASSAATRDIAEEVGRADLLLGNNVARKMRNKARRKLRATFGY
jgi:hypothetical protein